MVISDAEILAFYKKLYKMNILSFQIRVHQLFDKDTANELVTKINKFQTPVGCVLRFYVNQMSVEQRCVFSGKRLHTYVCKYTGRWLCEMHDVFFSKRHVMLKKINKILPRKLPRVLRDIVEEYISRHFIEIYESLCVDDRNELHAYYESFICF